MYNIIPGARRPLGGAGLPCRWGVYEYELYYVILYHAIVYYDIVYYTTILYYTVLYYTILYCTLRSHFGSEIDKQPSRQKTLPAHHGGCEEREGPVLRPQEDRRGD